MEMMQFTFFRRLQISRLHGVFILSIMSVAMSGVLPPEFVRASLKKSFIVPDAYTEAANNGIEVKIYFPNQQCLILKITACLHELVNWRIKI